MTSVLQENSKLQDRMTNCQTRGPGNCSLWRYSVISQTRGLVTVSARSALSTCTVRYRMVLTSDSKQEHLPFLDKVASVEATAFKANVVFAEDVLLGIGQKFGVIAPEVVVSGDIRALWVVVC